MAGLEPANQMDSLGHPTECYLLCPNALATRLADSVALGTLELGTDLDQLTTKCWAARARRLVIAAVRIFHPVLRGIVVSGIIHFQAEAKGACRLLLSIEQAVLALAAMQIIPPSNVEANVTR